MALDVVSPRSARVSAALALASTILFTVFKLFTPLEVRSVLDVYSAKALHPLLLVLCEFFTDTVPELLWMAASLAIQLLDAILSIVGPYLVPALSCVVSAIDPYVPEPPIQFCVLGTGIHCGADLARPNVSDLADQLVCHLVGLARSSYGSFVDALSWLFSTTFGSGIVGCSLSLLCCFGLVFCYSLWVLDSFETPLDEEELSAIIKVDAVFALARDKALAIFGWLRRRLPDLLPSLLLLHTIWKSQYSPLWRTTNASDTFVIHQLPGSLNQLLSVALSSAVTRYLLTAGVLAAVLCVVAYGSLFVWVIWATYYSRTGFAVVPTAASDILPIDQAREDPDILEPEVCSVVQDTSERERTPQNQTSEIVSQSNNSSSPEDANPEENQRATPEVVSQENDLSVWEDIDEDDSEWVTLEGDISDDLEDPYANATEEVPPEAASQVDEEITRALDVVSVQRSLGNADIVVPGGQSSRETPRQYDTSPDTRPHRGDPLNDAALQTSSEPSPIGHCDATRNDEAPPRVEARTISPSFPENYYLHSEFNEKYELGRAIGEGAQGFVIGGHRRRDGKKVAVKFIPVAHDGVVGPRHWWDHPRFGRIPHEVQMMLFLGYHKNLATLKDIFKDDTYVYIVQEFRGTLWYPRDEDGELIWPEGNCSLYAYLLQNDKMSVSEAKYVFKQLAQVMVFCHSKGITHVDIKSNNITIDADLNLTVIDFGSSLFSRKLPRPWLINGRGYAGTRRYMPPEVHNSQRCLPERGDVWAMGCVLYEMLTGGHHPFSTVEMAREGTLLWRLSELKGRIEGIEALWPVIEDCFIMDPQRRISSLRLSNHPCLE